MISTSANPGDSGADGARPGPASAGWRLVLAIAVLCLILLGGAGTWAAYGIAGALLWLRLGDLVQSRFPMSATRVVNAGMAAAFVLMGVTLLFKLRGVLLTALAALAVFVVVRR